MKTRPSRRSGETRTSDTVIATASRLETGQPIVSMALYDIGPGERRFLRVSAPLSVMLIPGVRITVDGQPGAAGPLEGRVERTISSVRVGRGSRASVAPATRGYAVSRLLLLL